MVRIEPVPWDDLPEESRAMLEAGAASGMYTTTMPMQVVAYSSAALQAMHAAYTATFGRGLLEPRLVELVRLRSAQAGGCAPCASSRKDDSVGEDDVACLVAPDPAVFAPRELAALRFFDQLCYDHHGIDEGTFRGLLEVFSPAEVVELGFLCGNFLGGHRFMHALDVLGDGEPLVRFDPSEIDRSQATADAGPA
ncbi:carboxymuconolactone decarboxylase family protein [Trujillonella humicola]|uniref:carboxymuconolactone decarboxylase family protein n=1 Tax=Trujillonella humicola TaxID=3383699 RepID=UPI003906B049